MFRTLSLGICFVIAAIVPAAAQARRYNLGRSATTEEIRARDISVAPDGTGLPAGSGTAAQGRAVYKAKCATCHGERGVGSADFPALVGGRGTLASDKPLPTVGSYWTYATTLWDYIRRAMPYQRPGSLRPDEVYSVTAYVLFMNGIVAQRQELSKESLPKVRMPNHDGFIPDRRPDVQSSVK